MSNPSVAARSPLWDEFIKILMQLILLSLVGTLFTYFLDQQSQQRDRRVRFYEAGRQAWEEITELTNRRAYRIERVYLNFLGSVDQLEAKDREQLENIWREYMVSVDEWNTKLPVNHGKLRRFFGEETAQNLISQVDPLQDTGVQKAFVTAHQQVLDLKVICAREIWIGPSGRINPRRCELKDSNKSGIKRDVDQAKAAIDQLKATISNFNRHLSDQALRRLAEIDGK
jgi:hypothetical protein